ncbi:MAG: hypothetical protein GX115_17620 [Ruminiclostridium sp.]|nr:hypothetical protein [Ruminiclostridium sp.]
MEPNHIEAARQDISIRCKKGLPFILAAAVLWTAITIIYALPSLLLWQKIYLTFFCSTPLIPLALLISKLIKAEFSVKNNPLSQLGFYFSIGQMLYFPIIMWMFPNAPKGFIMGLAIITGAHFLPFSWLYRSRAYLIMSIVIPIVISVMGWSAEPSQLVRVPAAMLVMILIFGIWLGIEVKNVGQRASSPATGVTDANS